MVVTGTTTTSAVTSLIAVRFKLLLLLRPEDPQLCSSAESFPLCNLNQERQIPSTRQRARSQLWDMPVRV